MRDFFVVLLNCIEKLVFGVNLTFISVFLLLIDFNMTHVF